MRLKYSLHGDSIKVHFYWEVARFQSIDVLEEVNSKMIS
jgi:hypothetical protein